MSFSPEMSQTDIISALLDQKLQSLHEKLDTVLGVSSKVKVLEGQVKELSEENQNLHRKVESLEKYSRKNNLRIYNLKETSGVQLELVIIKIFNECITAHQGYEPFDSRTFEAVHRIGGAKHGKTRTVLARFCNFKDKHFAFQLKQQLKQGYNISISDDFTREAEDRRNQIYPIFKSIQHFQNQKPAQERKPVTLKQDKLILDGKVYSVDNLDSLPTDFKPSMLCTKTKNNITAFFRQGSPLSNHHACKFTVNGESYTSAEQYLMAAKVELFGDHESVVSIKRATNPKIQKSLGGKIKGYVKETWISEAPSILLKGLMEKFKQNDGLAAFLLATENTAIAEANPKDLLFGVGIGLEDPQVFQKESWKGRNILGLTLEKVRAAIREQ